MSENIRVLLPEEELAARIAELGDQISKDYEGESVFLVCILKGASFFACELAKSVQFRCLTFTQTSVRKFLLCQ